ncbi:MAG: bifunctional DNA-binding transcriptional regulator/O6-methylguanine-DNA methyltransferase Ada [Acidobacteriota bacterium]|nr:bifunctional DNA-binding transcriptional regulator/O6-methylguanine-DNA methyltransferase Ada [Acidobacteriota bacterium]
MKHTSSARPNPSPQAPPCRLQTTETLWQQVLARDSRADGSFVYAVRTTGIFCRPGCPSRRPAEKNVAFFATPAEAAAAGFRACLRCLPDRPCEAPTERSRKRVRELAQLLTHTGGQPKSLAVLAKTAGTGRLTLMRGFRQVLGITPREYAGARRLARFTTALETTSPSEPSGGHPAPPAASVTDALYTAGFSSPSRLYESSRATLGMTPRTLQQHGAGATIRYATADSPLGRILVAATELGVCAILFGDDDAHLLVELRGRFHRAQLEPSSPQHPSLAEALAYALSQTTEHPLAATFPLDIRATAFQYRVWKALRDIPRGETRSYSQIAREIGRPSAVRAVAAAIGANPVALAVPCHRVVGKDGSMTGYRWGIDRKQRLLRAESASDSGEGATRG